VVKMHQKNLKVKYLSGSQFIIPKLLTATQSAKFNNKKANPKLITIVVNVKKKLGTACFHFL